MVSVEAIEEEAMLALQSTQSTDNVKAIELEFLGKSGKLSLLMREIGKIPVEERPNFGQSINNAKSRLEIAIEAIRSKLLATEMESQFLNEKIDFSMPGRRIHRPIQHVLHKTMLQVKSILSGLGFEYRESGDVETLKYNFGDLNYPEDHPAMDDQDTFYIDDEWLLRTQTTALQGHIFESVEPPLRVFTIGRCYRNEAVDRTHGHTFHQVDAFMIDENVSMAHLRGTLATLARDLFGNEIKTRFRPDFFPFVEPGVDFAISTPKFQNGNWLELGGAGLIHPNILENFGIDSKRYSGFAFGLGIERMPMLKYGIDDLRNFFENEQRFLEVFA